MAEPLLVARVIPNGDAAGDGFDCFAWLHVTALCLGGERTALLIVLVLASWPRMWTPRLCSIMLVAAGWCVRVLVAASGASC